MKNTTRKQPTRHISGLLLLLLLATLPGVTSCLLEDEPTQARPGPTPNLTHQEDQTEPQVETAVNKVVYGADNRTDYYESTDEDLKRITRQSIVALIGAGSLDVSNPDNVKVRASTLGREFGLCTNQRFRDQPAAASCSGTLIGPDLVLTAGHCAESTYQCKSFYYVFNYYYEAPGQLAPITHGEVYNCSKVLVQALSNTMDYAIIKLNRPVTGDKVPAKVKLDKAPITQGSPVTIIGFGSGIPAKIDTGGVVTNSRTARLDYFEATVDAFGGNSGSGVFNSDNELVGILARGNEDYILRRNCYEVNTLPASGHPYGQEEEITYAWNALNAFCTSRDALDSVCNPSPCPENAHQDGDLCVCNEGWQSTHDGQACEPIPVVECPDNATEVDGECHCNEGYQPDPGGDHCVPEQVDLPTCGTIDEQGVCEEDVLHFCEPDEQDQTGASHLVTADCKEVDLVCGFSGELGAYACIEPELNAQCPDNAHISSEDTCLCNPGYVADSTGKECVSEEEDTDSTYPPVCPDNATWSFILDSCVCNLGYVATVNGQHCYPEDTCPPNGAFNTETGFCECRTGYRPSSDGNSCLARSYNYSSSTGCSIMLGQHQGAGSAPDGPPANHGRPVPIVLVGLLWLGGMIIRKRMNRNR